MRISDWSSDVCSSDLASLIHHAQPIAWWEVVALAFSLGIVNGLALNTGHELGHKKEPFDRWMAKIVLAVVGYGHFFIEHNKGHPRDVATPEAPATSRMGDSLYQFSLREITGAFLRAWNLEQVRLERVGKGVWSPDNEIIPPLMKIGSASCRERECK